MKKINIQKETKSSMPKTIYSTFHWKSIFPKLFFLLIFMIGANLSSLHAQNFNEIIKAVASDPGSNEIFGFSVAIDGDLAVVGARYDSENGTGSGAAYIFQKDHGGNDNWGEVKKLTASDGAYRDYFGHSVAISGDYIIVGAREDDTYRGSDKGSVYIFHKNHGGIDNWGEEKKLTPYYMPQYGRFGTSVAIDGDYLIVGAMNDNVQGQYSGSAFIFQKDHGGTNNWGLVRKILASDGSSNNGFGYSVSISGDFAIVGAYTKGAAYLFQRDQGGSNYWGEVQKLTPSSASNSTNGRFGGSVSIDGDFVVVGAQFDNHGSAFIFQKMQNEWEEVKKIKGSNHNPVTYELFGVSVSISGDLVIVGAFLNNAGFIRAGAAYIFEKNSGGANNWGEVQQLTASDGADDDRFGNSVSISGDIAIAGAYAQDPSGINNAGAAYFFQNCQEVTCYADTDNDGFGDSDNPQVFCEVCDPGYVLDNTDNCPDEANADQADLDGDGLGDVCDAIVSVCDAMNILAAQVSSINLPNNTNNFLLNKLSKATAKYQQGNNNAAAGNLGAFMNKVNAKSPSQISPSDAADLIAIATAISAAIDNGNTDCTNSGQNYVAPNLGNTISTITHQQDMEISPNPASSDVNIQLIGFEETIVELRIFDQLGRQVLLQNLAEGTHQVNLNLPKNQFANGVYFVMISTEDNLISKRLLINR